MGSDGKYVDEDFPPNKSSLIRDWNNYDKVDCKGWEDYKWKRLSEIESVNADGKISVF